MGDMRSDDVDQRVIDRYERNVARKRMTREGIAVAVWVMGIRSMKEMLE